MILRFRALVELLIVGLVVEAASRGEELGIRPVTLLTSDTDVRRETAIPRLVEHLACELAIAPVDVETRISQHFTDYRASTPMATEPSWLPPRVWPFCDVDH